MNCKFYFQHYSSYIVQTGEKPLPVTNLGNDFLNISTTTIRSRQP